MNGELSVSMNESATGTASAAARETEGGLESEPAARRLRVAIDATAALRQRAGIGRFAREMIRALLARDAHDYRLLVLDRRRGEEPALAELLVAAPAGRRPPLRFLPLPERALTLAWHRLRLPLPLDPWLDDAEVAHFPDYLAPPARRPALVATVHDLSFLAHPERAEPALARFLARALPRSLRRCAVVLADSESTRRDLVARLGIEESRTARAYGGVDPGIGRVRDPAALAALRDRLGLDRPFVLGVGTLEPRKDWPTLIRAFERAAMGPLAGHALVIAGGRGWREGPILEAAAASGADVRLLGFVPDQDLPALYSLAAAFAFPSVYEGFGLPPLEALACGVPTAVSDVSSLPEVVGDAALRVPPGDEAAWAAALARLGTDAALRARLAAAGPARAARFTWARCAAEVEAAYEAAAAAGPRRG